MYVNVLDVFGQIYHLISDLHTGDPDVIMITQQLGDGPPGDNHYFDLEDEEPRGATGGGCNPNVPAWDLRKWNSAGLWTGSWRREGT